ncbi:hypothetical protein SOVF_205440, partial [Spinacia oleracea]
MANTRRQARRASNGGNSKQSTKPYPETPITENEIMTLKSGLARLQQQAQ